MRPAVLCILLAVAEYARCAGPDENLVQSLRRQLMDNNYDYSESNDNAPSPTPLEPSEPSPPARRDYANAEYIESARGKPHIHQDRERNDSYEQDGPEQRDGLDERDRQNELDRQDERDGLDERNSLVQRDGLDQRDGLYQQNRQDERDARYAGTEQRDITVKDRDLLYYMDEQHFRDGGMLGRRAEPPPTTAKYKLLKVPGLSGRRGGGGGRFLQEERPGRVAILQLNDGPFPGFRLPRERRQYMEDGDTDPADTDRELAAHARRVMPLPGALPPPRRQLVPDPEPETTPSPPPTPPPPRRHPRAPLGPPRPPRAPRPHRMGRLDSLTDYPLSDPSQRLDSTEWDARRLAADQLLDDPLIDELLYFSN